MTVVVLALAAAAAWGTADFLGGRVTRDLAATTVVLVSKAAALVLLLPLAVGLDQLPSGDGLAWALVAGPIGIAAVSALYAALASGPMSLVAPVTACSALVPATIALLGGESVTALAAAGMLCAFGGAVLVSRPPTDPGAAGLDARSLGVALVAAGLLGGWTATVQQAALAADDAAFGITALGTLTGLLTLAAALAVRGAFPRPTRAHLGSVVGLGLLDAAGLALYAAATGPGDAAPVAILGSLYPVVTILLARALLAERMSGGQAFGVVVTFVGIGLLTAGLA